MCSVASDGSIARSRVAMGRAFSRWSMTSRKTAAGNRQRATGNRLRATGYGLREVFEIVQILVPTCSLLVDFQVVERNHGHGDAIDVETHRPGVTRPEGHAVDRGHDFNPKWRNAEAHERSRVDEHICGRNARTDT